MYVCPVIVCICQAINYMYLSGVLPNLIHMLYCQLCKGKFVAMQSTKPYNMLWCFKTIDLQNVMPEEHQHCKEEYLVLQNY